MTALAPSGVGRTGAETEPRRRPRDRKATILRVAADLFASRGFASVSLTEIAEGVGISPAAMYRHYAGKEGVLDAVLLDALASYRVAFADAVRAATEHGDGPEQVLSRAIGNTVQLALDRPAVLATYLRERRRIGRGRLTELGGEDVAVFGSWADTVLAVRPELDKGEVASRLQASLGGLVGMSIASTPAAAPAAAELVTSGLVALLSMPPNPTFRIVDQPVAPAWAPEPSRRQAFLHSALALFREAGYDGVGIDDLGAAVGISGPAVYAWFDSKAQILVDMFDLMVSRQASASVRALRDATSPADALDRLVRAYVQVAYDSTALLAVTGRELYALPRDDQRRMARRRIDLGEPWLAVLGEVRPDLGADQHRLLTEVVLHLTRRCAERRRPTGPSIDATADLALTFLLDSSPVRA